MSLKLVFVFLVSFITCSLAAQKGNNTNFPIRDEWYRKFRNKGLKVGDRMPDITLGTVINNNLTGKKRISDFAGKLIIFDFWDTKCSVCLEGFPYMEQLQEQFQEKIQVILVNPSETETQIHESLSRKENFGLPNLPCIVLPDNDDENKHDTLLSQLFPSKGFPLHVWIGPEGIVRMIGGPENTYPEKIHQLLSGETISFLNSQVTLPALYADRNAAYYQQLGSLQQTPLTFGTIITPYNNELTGERKIILDSTHNRRIEHFINKELLELYQYAVMGNWDEKKRSRLLFSPVSFEQDLVIYPQGADTSLFTFFNYPFFINKYKRKITDLDMLKNRYCYEQIIPLNVPDSVRYQLMLRDLNNYFQYSLGILGVSEPRRIRCYVITKTVTNAGGTRTNNEAVPDEESCHDGAFVRSNLRSFIERSIRSNDALYDVFLANQKSGKPFLIIDESGDIDKQVQILKKSFTRLNTIEDLRMLLSGYHLNLIEADRTVDFLVFKKVNL